VAVSNNELLELETDILVPAAVQSVIDENNVARVKTKLIIEAANGPITPTAEVYLSGKNITVIPDVVANVGGAIVCHFERIQGLTDEYWDIVKVRSQLKEWILRSYHQMIDTAESFNTTYRMAAWITALKKIETSVKIRGWI